MHYLKRLSRKNGDDAVSPVVGVMLMLVVTIIIAAVVSAFAGSTVSGTQKAPSATVEIHVKNGGDNSTSYFTMKVLGVSDPIPTKNLKVVTSWTTTSRTDGTALNGGNVTYASLASASSKDDLTYTKFSVPTGYGAGVSGWANSMYHNETAQWGNFTLTSGTFCSDNPSSDYSSFAYTSHTGIDPMQAILGGGWNNLKQGDIVTVRIIHTPSGKELVDQQVAVEG
jgi:archaeal type IV pilus assembly protein PilA